MANKQTVWDLMLEITGDDKGATAALKAVKRGIQDVQASGKQLGKDFKAFAGNAAKLAMGVTAGVTAAAAGVMSMANEFANAGEKVLKAAEATGIGIEAYQELQYAMGKSGVSVESFDSALNKFNLTVRQGAAGNVAAAKQLEAVGLSAEKLAAMSPEQSLMRLSDYLHSLPDDAERTRVAVQLFGKSAGPEMMVALKQGSEAIANLRDESKSATFTFSKDQAELSRQFQNTKKGLAGAFENIKFSFIAGSIGPVTQALKTMQETVLSSVPSITELGEKFGLWLGEVIQKLPEIVSKVKEFATNVWENVNAVKDFVGGWKNVAKILAGLAIAPTFISGIKTVFSLGGLVKTAIGAIGSAVKGTSVLFGLFSGKIDLATAAANKNKLAQFILAAQMVKNKVATAAFTVAQKAAQGINFVGTIIKQGAAFVALKAQLIAAKVATVAFAVAQKAAAAASKIAATVQWALNAAMAANPIGLIIAGIAGLIAIIVLVVKNFDKIKVVAGKVFEFLKTGLSAMGEFFKKVWGGITGFVSGVFEKIKGVFASVIDWVKNNWQSIVAFIINPFAGVFKYLYDNFEGFRNFVDGVVSAIKNFFVGLWEGIKNVFSGVGNWFGVKFSEAKEGATKGWENVTSFFGKVGSGIKGAFSTMGNWFKDKFNAAKEGATNAWKNAPGFFQGVWGNIKGKFQEGVGIVDNIVGGLPQPFQNVYNGIKNIIGNVVNFLKNAFGNAVAAIKNIVSLLPNLFSDPIGTIKAIVGEVTGFFKNTFGGVFDALKQKILGFVNFFAEKMKAVKDFFGGVGEKVGNFASGAFGKIKSVLPGHAEGGIFTKPHIAKFAERGAEAAVPLDKSPRGFNIWKQAGEMGGYFDKRFQPPETRTATAKQEPPTVMQAAARSIAGGDSNITIHFSQNNTFNGTADKETVNQVSAAGREAADDLEARVKAVLENIARNQRRVAYA